MLRSLVSAYPATLLCLPADEVFAFSLAPPADGIEAPVLFVYKLAGTAQQAAPAAKRQRIGDAGTSSAGGRASNTAGGPGSSSKQAHPPKLPQVSTAGNGSRGVSPAVSKVLQYQQQPQQQQPMTPAAAAAAAAVRRATMTAGGGSVTRPNPGPSSSNQGMSWLLDRPVVQQVGAGTGSGLCGSINSRGKAGGRGSSGSSRGGCTWWPWCWWWQQRHWQQRQGQREGWHCVQQ